MKEKLLQRLNDKLESAKRSLSDGLVRDTVHLYSVLGQTRYVEYTLEVTSVMSRLDLRRILDWGALYGHMSFLLRECGLEVESMDIAPEDQRGNHVEQSKIFDVPILKVQDRERIPYETDSFDAVLAMGVLEHVQNEKASIREVHRILRSRGLFFVYHLPNKYSWIEYIHDLRGVSDHPVKYKASDLPSKFSQEGFEVLRAPQFEYILPQNFKDFPHQFRQFVNKIAPILEVVDTVLLATPLKYSSTSMNTILRKK